VIIATHSSCECVFTSALLGSGADSPCACSTVAVTYLPFKEVLDGMYILAYSVGAIRLIATVPVPCPVRPTLTSPLSRQLQLIDTLCSEHISDKYR
jgi:hypothetical protein